MKKVLVTIAIAMASLVAANAQTFVGGDASLLLNSSNWTDDNSNTSGDNPSTFGLTIAPKFGYSLNTNFSIGAALGIGLTSTDYKDAATTFDKTTATKLGIMPFARYTFLHFGKVGIAAEAQLPISYTSTENKYVGGTKLTPTTFGIGLDVKPVLTYDLSEKFQLEAYLNFVDFHFDYASTNNDAKYKTSSTSFGIGASADNLFTTGNITVGCTYKF
jgi:hypothetical protein